MIFNCIANERTIRGIDNGTNSRYNGKDAFWW